MGQNRKDLDVYTGIEKLLKLMEALRRPEDGCPWDVEQTFETIAPYTIEEAYEVADAIERGNVEDICEELGDLLLQVVFQAQIAKEDGLFDFSDVAQKVADKMISRHPHVFADVEVGDADSVVSIWEAQKDKEKAPSSAMDHITLGLPALMRAQKIQKKAIKAGFRWDDPKQAFAKLREEIDELEQAYDQQQDQEIEAEYGDVLFSAALLGRYIGHDAENRLKDANTQFIRRFRAMESGLGDQTLTQLKEDDKLNRWQEAKKQAS